MRYVFLALGVMATAVSLSITNRIASDWDSYLIGGSLHPNFVIGFVWFVSIACFVFSAMFSVERKVN